MIMRGSKLTINVSEIIITDAAHNAVVAEK